jgi:hypothetical protein
MAAAYVLDVPEGPVHHGVSERVRHDGRVTKQRVRGAWQIWARDVDSYLDVKDLRREEFVQRVR